MNRNALRQGSGVVVLLVARLDLVRPVTDAVCVRGREQAPLAHLRGQIVLDAVGAPALRLRRGQALAKGADVELVRAQLKDDVLGEGRVWGRTVPTPLRVQLQHQARPAEEHHVVGGGDSKVVLDDGDLFPREIVVFHPAGRR